LFCVLTKQQLALLACEDTSQGIRKVKKHYFDIFNPVISSVNTSPLSVVIEIIRLCVLEVPPPQSHLQRNLSEVNSLSNKPLYHRIYIPTH